MSKFLLHSLQQIERTGQASFNETLRLMSDGFIEVEGGGYYRLTPAGEAELARLLLLDPDAYADLVVIGVLGPTGAPIAGKTAKSGRTSRD